MTQSDLEALALARFDELVKDRKLFWEENEAIPIKGEPFNFQFRIADNLNIKPNLAPDDPRRMDTSNPFADPDTRFDVGDFEPKHRLILNKYPVIRPQFVLYTKEFEKQSDPLTIEDVIAFNNALESLAGEYFVLYNCGADAGSSLGHKHVQILPHPKQSDLQFFPDSIQEPNGCCSHPEVPFVHAFHKLPDVMNAETTFKIYTILCEHLDLKHGSAHNVLVTKRWILVIPRSRARQGLITANGAGMIGMVWVPNKEILDAWLDFGPMKALSGFGYL